MELLWIAARTVLDCLRLLLRAPQRKSEELPAYDDPDPDHDTDEHDDTEK